MYISNLLALVIFEKMFILLSFYLNSETCLFDWTISKLIAYRSICYPYYTPRYEVYGGYILRTARTLFVQSRQAYVCLHNTENDVDDI